MPQLESASMVAKGNILDYRSKLDKTLTSPDLMSDKIIHSLVKNQILQSLACESEEYNEYVVERRSKEMLNFLSMLRSASANEVDRSKSSNESQSGWKIKQDTDEFRVMYREGPEGTPFHTLLVEGYVDGPLDVCLCVSSESDLYKKWWPQSAIPTFKVVSSQCVQKVRIGEQISLVRMKVSWPLSSREALVHYFVFEYFQEGLIVVLLNSISDSETVNRSTHGFTRDGIPDAQDVVRIGVVGGFAIQKVTQDRSYFRTIANVDLKLDFVPPAFINFLSRQLVGSGFKLYKKEVASVSRGDEKFLEALKGPLYTRIHEALYSQSTSVMLKEPPIEDKKVLDEIEEFDEKDVEESESLDNLGKEITEEVIEVEKATSGTMEQVSPEMKNKVSVRLEVQQALGTLEKAITILREYNISSPVKDQCDVEEKGHSIHSGEENLQTRRNNGIYGESSKNTGSTELTSRHKGSDSYVAETNQSKIAPASPDEDRSTPSHTKHLVSEKTAENCSISADAKGINGNRATKIKNRKSKFLCLKVMSV